MSSESDSSSSQGAGPVGPGAVLTLPKISSGEEKQLPQSAGCPFNGGSHDFATGHRYERKFLAPQAQWVRVEQIIRANPAVFSTIYQPRAVNNLYLDTPGLSYYAMNLAGASQRFKVRIRWYGAFFGELVRPVLELKIKEGLVGTKQSFSLRPFTMEAGFRAKMLRSVFRESGLPGHVQSLMAGLEPSLLNRYQRAYFQSADRRYRLTLDSSLEFVRVRLRGISSFRRAPHVPFRVLELKFQQEHAEGADAIAGSFPFRVTRMSKYAFGIECVEDW